MIVHLKVALAAMVPDDHARTPSSISTRESAIFAASAGMFKKSVADGETNVSKVLPVPDHQLPLTRWWARSPDYHQTGALQVVMRVRK